MDYKDLHQKLESGCFSILFCLQAHNVSSTLLIVHGNNFSTLMTLGLIERAVDGSVEEDNMK